MERLPQLTRGEERTLHLCLFATVLWVLALSVMFSRSEKGDFAHFYTLAAAVQQHHYAALVSDEQLRAVQIAATGDAGHYPPVYGPQVGLALQPLAWLPCDAAHVVFSVASGLLVAWCILVFVRRRPALQPWRWRVVALALIAPAVFHVVANGQLSPLALAALALAVPALERRSPIALGVAIGLLLGYKPTLLVPALAVLALAAEWRAVLLAGIAAVAEVGITAPIVGPHVVLTYAESLQQLAMTPGVMAARPALMASLRTLWALMLPAPVVTPVYAVTAGAVVVVAAQAWRRQADPLHRVAILGLSMALCAPHLYFYDLVVLAPCFVLWADRALTSRSARVWILLAYLAPLLAPLAAWTHVQVVTLVLAGWLLATTRHLALVEVGAPVSTAPRGA